jgi:hypothetical protein
MPGAGALDSKSGDRAAAEVGMPLATTALDLGALRFMAVHGALLRLRHCAECRAASRGDPQASPKPEAPSPKPQAPSPSIKPQGSSLFFFHVH